MTEASFLERIETCLVPRGARRLEGEAYRDPPLEILAYFTRPIRLSAMPVLGRSLSAVAIARQPADLGFDESQARRFLDRLILAVNARLPRFGPSGGLSVGLTAVVLTPEPIAAGDEATLDRVLSGNFRARSVPLGCFRANLGQEAMAFALRTGPLGLYEEPTQLADALTPVLKRFVPPVAW